MTAIPENTLKRLNELIDKRTPNAIHGVRNLGVSEEVFRFVSNRNLAELIAGTRDLNYDLIRELKVIAIQAEANEQRKKKAAPVCLIQAKQLGYALINLNCSNSQVHVATGLTPNEVQTLGKEIKQTFGSKGEPLQSRPTNLTMRLIATIFMHHFRKSIAVAAERDFTGSDIALTENNIGYDCDEQQQMSATFIARKLTINEIKALDIAECLKWVGEILKRDKYFAFDDLYVSYGTLLSISSELMVNSMLQNERVVSKRTIIKEDFCPSCGVEYVYFFGNEEEIQHECPYCEFHNLITKAIEDAKTLKKLSPYRASRWWHRPPHKWVPAQADADHGRKEERKQPNNMKTKGKNRK